MQQRRHSLDLHDPVVADLGDLSALTSSDQLRPAYQPIVDVSTGEVIAYEALARWPGLPGVTPDAVFAAARLAGRTAELDWACRLAALRGALEHGLGREHVLFVNVEPEALGVEPPPEGRAVLQAARRELRVTLELTERSLVRRPAALLRLVAWARSQGWGLALDDVGAEPASLALLPFLAPDVVKLDMSLVRCRPTPDQAAIMAAVMSHAEQTGATILAEGIETDSHLDQALALGATLGQGWRFGRPGPLGRAECPSSPLQPPDTVPPVPVTPYAATRDRGRRIGRKGLLIDLSLHIEHHGQDDRTTNVVLSAFQTADRFTPATVARYRALAARSPLVAAFGVGLSPDPSSGVHVVGLDPADPLAGEWTVTAVGPHHAAALIARDLGDDGPDLDRRFEFVVTHDRPTVLAAARSLMARITSPVEHPAPV